MPSRSSRQLPSTQRSCIFPGRQALAAGEKWCEVDLGDGPVRMRSLKYSEVSRCHIRNEILDLPVADRAEVDRVLGPLGVLDAYLLEPVL